jgi:hypothetical protein
MQGMSRASIGGLAWLALCLSASAGEYNIKANIGEILSADLSPSGLPPSRLTDHPGVSRVYRVDFTLHADGFNPSADQRGFGNILFDINSHGTNLRASSAFGSKWQPNATMTPDLNGSADGGIFPLWDVNADDGQSDDLQFIFASIDVIPAPVQLDPRPGVGQGAGTLLGSIYYEWNGLGSAAITVLPRTTPNGAQVSFARISNGNLVLDSTAIVEGDQLSLFASADFDENGTVDSHDLTLWSDNYFISQDATHNQGDANSNGIIDGADFLLWQRQYRGQEVATVHAVPEVATAWLTLTALSLAAIMRRKWLGLL